MSGPLLKRYTVREGAHAPYGLESPDGSLVSIDDVHAILETLRAIEAGRECDDVCVSMRADMKCNCVHGRMMAAIEEALK